MISQTDTRMDTHSSIRWGTQMGTRPVPGLVPVEVQRPPRMRDVFAIRLMVERIALPPRVHGVFTLVAEPKGGILCCEDMAGDPLECTAFLTSSPGYF